MTDREIMQQALDALEMHVLGFDGVRKMELAIEALETALAQPEQAPKLTDAGADTNISRGLEPKGSGMVTLNKFGMRVDLNGGTRKTWVGLTDEEREAIILESYRKYNDGDPDFIAVEIEAKLKEKNT